MTPTPTLPPHLASLLARGVRLRAEGEHLDVEAPEGLLSAGDYAQFAGCKPELLALLAPADARLADALGLLDRLEAGLRSKAAYTPARGRVLAEYRSVVRGYRDELDLGMLADSPEAVRTLAARWQIDLNDAPAAPAGPHQGDGTTDTAPAAWAGGQTRTETRGPSRWQ